MHQSCKNERRYLYHKNDTRLQNTFPFEEKFDKYAGSNSIWAFNVFTSTLNGCKSRFGILPEDLTQRNSSIWFQHDNDLQYTNLKKREG